MDHSFTILVDTKEKQPWVFLDSAVQDVVFQHIETGDYTVEGYEELLCIERKKSIAELAGNIHQDRFTRELQRMTEFPYRYIVVESSFEHVVNYPFMEGLPPKIERKLQVRGKYLVKCFARLQVKYGINIIYCGNKERAQLMALYLMKEVLNLHGEN